VQGIRSIHLQEYPSNDSRNTDQKVHRPSLFTNRNQTYNFKAHAQGVGGVKYNVSPSKNSRKTEQMVLHYSYKVSFIVDRSQNYVACSE
jgi:hypothetical protein